jgi:hypothetical protein
MYCLHCTVSLISSVGLQWGRRLEGWSNTAARLAGWRRVPQRGVSLYVMDGPLLNVHKTPSWATSFKEGIAWHSSIYPCLLSACLHVPCTIFGTWFYVRLYTVNLAEGMFILFSWRINVWGKYLENSRIPLHLEDLEFIFKFLLTQSLNHYTIHIHPNEPNPKGISNSIDTVYIVLACFIYSPLVTLKIHTYLTSEPLPRKYLFERSACTCSAWFI